ncbi:prepilin-type N-terminal cleavage/methylation domain-containing protein [Geminocystis sp. CENA526]|uniref:prepilin-type N-terminal cleavage/methylation domain-containing protein n=1 Tax=Geminocystis sp. CENA526 TaxID=1355871 RepID=UPI003D6E6E4F
MQLLVVNLLNLFNERSKQKGFTLFEVVVVSIIIGIVSAVAAPNLIESQRQERVNRTFSQVRSALVEAQVNANRMSRNCPITITTTSVTSAVSGCLLENIVIDSSIVDVRTSKTGGLPQTVTFDYKGGIPVTDIQTIHIARKNFSNTAINETGKCIVLANTIGMIRTGIYDSTVSGTNCNNVENRRYDTGG